MLLILLAAQALPGAVPPAPAEPPRQGRQQIFIAPSGEPFRAPEGAPYPVADWFAGADRNHDGKLTESEFTVDFLRYVDSLDIDHDGVVDSAELDRYETEMAPELHTGTFAGSFAPEPDENGEVGQNRRSLGSYMGANDPRGAGRYDLLGIPEPVASMDTTLKGRINRQAAQDAAEYRFSLLDTQHHGYLLLAELPQSYAQTHRNVGGKHRGGGGKRGGHWRHGGSRDGMGGREGMGGNMVGGMGDAAGTDGP